MAFRQICGGFIKATGEVFKDNPKIDALRDIVEIATDSSKIVIFHQFIQEGLLIENLLKKMKIKYSYLNGRTKNHHEQIKAFQKDDSVLAMVAHPKSGGSSIDLVEAEYCTFFSNISEPIERMQCEKRIHRGGQTAKRVYYYDILMNASVDITIYRNLRNEVNYIDRVVDGETDRKALLGEL
jgi:SNF2 family DNA or RNA helicase